FEALRLGIRSAWNVPAVIFEALRFGTRSGWNVPEVTFDAGRLGTWSTTTGVIPQVPPGDRDHCWFSTCTTEPGRFKYASASGVAARAPPLPHQQRRSTTVVSSLAP